jgi:peroxiredoxin
LEIYIVKIFFFTFFSVSLLLASNSPTAGAEDLRPFLRRLATSDPNSRAPSELSSVPPRITVIFFIADWCEYCKGEMEPVARLFKKYQAQGLNIIGVALDTSDEGLQQLKRKYKIPYAVLQDKEGFSRKKFKIKMLPYFMVLNREGRRISDFSGVKDIGDFYSAIKKTIEKKSPPPP